MTILFLSHSSQDKRLARRVARDLEAADISVWLDEWEILVGDSITQRIQCGLDESDFVAVLLTRHSIGSGWVTKEWQSQIGKEATTKGVLVLPLRVDNCSVPTLLFDKKFADFRNDYATGLGELVTAVKGHTLRNSCHAASLQSRYQEAPIHNTAGTEDGESADSDSSFTAMRFDSFLAVMRGFPTDNQKLDFVSSNRHRIEGSIPFSQLDSLLGLFRLDSSKLSALELIRDHLTLLSPTHLEHLVAHFELGVSRQSALELLG